jgi:hypothetical protein
MAKRTVYNNLNRGEVSDSAVCRDDVKFINESASLVENFLPNRMGGMGMRPGSGYLGTLLGASYLVPFTRSIDDQALLEFSNNKLRFWVDDVLVTRRNVNAASQLGALSTWARYGTGADYNAGPETITVFADGSVRCDAYGYIALHADDQNQEIGLKIVISDGPLEVRIGSTSGALKDDLFRGWLNPGTYSFALTSPTGIAVTVSSDKDYVGTLVSCQIEDNVNLELTTTITTAMLPSIRAAQVNDVVFVTADSGSTNTHPQHKVMRYGSKSWGYVPVRCDDGPFRDINIGTTSMTPAALTGDTTLTASQAYFSSSHVGALFKVASKGQLVTKAFTAASQSSNSIKVLGSGSARKFNFTRTVVGVWGGVTTLALQQSTDDATWTDYDTYITGVGTLTINDGLDNQTMYYRLYTNAWDGNPSQIDTTLNYPGGSILGTCRVTSYTSSTVVNIQVLESFGSTTASDNWYEGAWSGKRGYPTAVTMYEGRLWYAGAGQIWGSVSDAFESFDRNVVGDSTSIYRSIAFESSANVHWLAEAVRLLVGITRDEISVRSSSFNEIVTQTNANLKGGTGQGAADIDCVSSNDSLYYVQRAGRKVLRLDYNSGSDGFQPVDTQLFHDTACEGSDGTGIKRIALAKQPDERLFVLLNDGTIRVFLTVPEQEVAGWSRITTKSGDTFKDIVVIPGTIEDRVYVVAYRNSAYMLEKLALMEDAIGDASSYTLDSYVYAAGPTTSVSCSHLANGTTMGIWANGVFLADVAISAGAVALGGTYSNVTVGLRYTAKYKSNKLSGFAPYSMLTERARVEDVGIIASNVVQGTLSYGKDFDNLVALPGVEDRSTISTTTRMSWMDYQPYPFRGSFKTDSRVCLQATGPVTIHCLTYGVVESKDKQGGA